MPEPTNDNLLFEGVSSTPTRTTIQTSKPSIRQFPPTVKYILAQEGCERFSYYGLRTVLPTFLKDVLGYSENHATAIMNAWKSLVYFTPIGGAIIADQYLGRYRTILWLSVLYVIGGGVLSLAGLTEWEWITFLSLGLLAVGSGGIKPSVCPFGGDQFGASESELKMLYFSYFYLSINIGSTPSQLLVPIVKEVAGYFEAFLIPAILLLVATVFFVYGKRLGYRMVPPKGSVLIDFVGIVWVGLKTPAPRERPVGWHWLDPARSSYNRAMVEDVKAVLRVLALFLPFPVFWSLYDQQDTRWTFQAQRMDRRLWGDVEIPAEAVQTVNPVLVIILVPFFVEVVYPAVEALGVRVTSLRKMIAGMFVASLAFVVAGLVQMKEDNACDDFVSCSASDEDGVACVSDSQCGGGICNLVSNATAAFMTCCGCEHDGSYYDSDSLLCYSDGDCADHDGHRISVWWQLPQYIVLTMGEVLTSVTAYEFAYSQAPSSMKSVVFAAWLLTTAVGDLLITVVAVINPFQDLAATNFFFAGLMFLVGLMVIPMAMNFQVVYVVEEVSPSQTQELTRALSDKSSASNTP